VTPVRKRVGYRTTVPQAVRLAEQRDLPMCNRRFRLRGAPPACYSPSSATQTPVAHEGNSTVTNGIEQRIRGSAALDPTKATCAAGRDMCALLN